MVTLGRSLLVLLGAISLLAAACSGGDSRAATPTPAPIASRATDATATSEPTATATVPATPTPAGVVVASTVQLVELRTGKVTTLYQDSNNAANNARFDGDTVVVAAGSRTLAFHFDGTSASVPAMQPCHPAGQKPIYCSSSPDGRWVTYPVENGEKTLASGYVVPLWDQWLMDVATGKAQMVEAGLVHCGGCDARYGPMWSPNSRYVAYAEYGGTGRRFLTDAQTGVTRQIGTGAEVGEAPVWSPDGNGLLYQEEDNGTVARFEDLAAGTSTALAVPWPAAFDPSGTLIYSPSADPDPKRPAPATAIINAATGLPVATLPGAPPQSFEWNAGVAIAAHAGSFVAALQRAPGCDGTAIYAGSSVAAQCVAGGEEGRVAPDGARIAVAKVTGSVGPVYGPGFQALTMPVYAVDVVTVGGAAMTVVPTAPSFQAPLMVWNASGTHVLIAWPHASGL